MTAKFLFFAALGLAFIAGAGAVGLMMSGRSGFAAIWAVFAVINVGIAFVNRELMRG